MPSEFPGCLKEQVEQEEVLHGVGVERLQREAEPLPTGDVRGRPRLVGAGNEVRQRLVAFLEKKKF